MTDDRQINERELRESEIRMTGRLPVPAPAFIGFVPATPSSGAGGAPASTGGALPQPAKPE